jgi:hypothetical protein
MILCAAAAWLPRVCQIKARPLALRRIRLAWELQLTGDRTEGIAEVGTHQAKGRYRRDCDQSCN